VFEDAHYRMPLSNTSSATDRHFDRALGGGGGRQWLRSTSACRADSLSPDASGDRRLASIGGERVEQIGDKVRVPAGSPSVARELWHDLTVTAHGADDTNAFGPR
jgi:hypothetical protein